MNFEQKASLKRNTHHLLAARQLDELVAFLVDQQLTVDALVALATQPPDAVRAERTEGSLKHTHNAMLSLVRGTDTGITQGCLYTDYARTIGS